jgi:CRP-like cAMP-binding protein
MNEPTRRKFPPMQVLVRQGEHGDLAWLIEDGELEIMVDDPATPTGLRRLLTIGRGAVVGEMVLIDRGPRTATVRTLTEVACIELSRMTFGRMLAKCEPLAVYTLESLIAAIRRARNLAAPRRSVEEGQIRSTRDFTKFVNRRAFPGQHIFFREGEAGDTAYLIQSGTVEVQSRRGAGAGLLGPGQIFGELALFGNSVYTVGARAIEPAVCEIIRKEQFRKALDSMPPVLRVLADNYVRQLSALPTPKRELHQGAPPSRPAMAAAAADQPTVSVQGMGVAPRPAALSGQPTILSQGAAAPGAIRVPPAPTTADGGRLCLNCYLPKPQAGACPACGYRPSQSPASPLLLPPGTWLLDRYRTGRLLGQGGFGATYLSWDERLQVRVAIKEYFPLHLVVRDRGGIGVVPQNPEYAGSLAEGIGKFLEEARIQARLRAIPEIVGIQDYFEANGTAYLVMDLLEGQTLKAYVAAHGGRIEFRQALRLLTPIMHALHAIHLQGLVHRDISPDNMFLSAKGEVKLLDFGAARRGGADDFTVILKQAYAPPEQYYRDGNQGPWSDVYAMAATLYFVLTGSPPPPAMQRLQEDVLKPPSALGVTIPADIEKVLLDALTLRYQERSASMKIMLAGFGRLLAAGK